MPDSRDVQRLLIEAGNAPTIGESQRLVTEAENLRTVLAEKIAADRGLDLAHAVIDERLTPVAVHEFHTAATDWIGDVDTAFDKTAMTNIILAEASLWYGDIPHEVKSYRDEFEQQAFGQARHLAGAYGEQAAEAEHAFINHVATLYGREKKAGLFTEAASTVPQVGEDGYPDGQFSTGGTYQGLPADATTSENAAVIQQLEANNGSNASQDVTPVNDPGLAQADTQVDRTDNSSGGPTDQVADAGQDKLARRTAAENMKCENCNDVAIPFKTDEAGMQWYSHGYNPDNNEHPVVVNGKTLPTVSPRGRIVSAKENHMQHAQCPTCGGHGRVAVRVAPQPTIASLVTGKRHKAVSGLDQLDQIVDPHDNGPAPTPLPQEVAFPWTIAPGQQEQTIQENAQQLAERQKMAKRAAELAYKQVLGGYDASGWMGDMGASGVGPGQQDGGNPGGVTNLGVPSEVYGWGGDNGNQPLKPYGQDEADDYTNNPGMNWQPGMPTQMDMSGQAGTTQGPAGGGGAPFPNPPMNDKKSSKIEQDPELVKALAFVRRRRAFLETQGR